MNTFKLTFYILAISILFVACGEEESAASKPDIFSYEIIIAEPTTEAKHVNDDLNFSIEFNSLSGETVHHINVRIYNKADNTEVYNAPGDAHIHEISGAYLYTDSFMLTNDNGINEHTDWILEAKVWGHEPGFEEVIETVEFHVHPE